MHKILAKTRQGTPVIRISKAEARKRFNAGQPIGVTDDAILQSDPDIFKADGDPMQWPVHEDFDSMANEQSYYAARRLVWWGVNTADGLIGGDPL